MATAHTTRWSRVDNAFSFGRHRYYPYQTMSTNAWTSAASTDAHWSKRILSDGKYKQMCFKQARVLHLSYAGKDYGDLDFNNKQIIKEFI